MAISIEELDTTVRAFYEGRGEQVRFALAFSCCSTASTSPRRWWEQAQFWLTAPALVARQQQKAAQNALNQVRRSPAKSSAGTPQDILHRPRRFYFSLRRLTLPPNSSKKTPMPGSWSTRFCPMRNTPRQSVSSRRRRPTLPYRLCPVGFANILFQTSACRF